MIGVICSAGGNSFFAAFDLFREIDAIRSEEIFLVTDRACGAEQLADDRGILRTRVESRDNAEFSILTADLFQEKGVESIILFYTRFIKSELFESFKTFNVHPSLLPLYPGFGALRRTLADGCRFVGATLHRVDKSEDGGEIVAQVVTPLSSAECIETLGTVSFLQKVYLTLLFFEEVSGMRDRDADSPVPFGASPALCNGVLAASFDRLCTAKGRRIIK